MLRPNGELLARAEPELARMGELAAGELYRLQLADRRSEPSLTQWDAWGERVDQLELTPLWRLAARLAAEYGLVALPYEQRYGGPRGSCSSPWPTSSTPRPMSTHARSR